MRNTFKLYDNKPKSTYESTKKRRIIRIKPIFPLKINALIFCSAYFWDNRFIIWFFKVDSLMLFKSNAMLLDNTASKKSHLRSFPQVA